MPSTTHKLQSQSQEDSSNGNDGTCTISDKTITSDYQKGSDQRITRAASPNKQLVALITGISGQCGSYLAELLIKKGYMVHGMIRRESSFSGIRLMQLYDDKINHTGKNLRVHYGDLTDSDSLLKLISSIKPNEVYNLAAQSHVKISFEMPELTANTNAIGTLKLLEAIKRCEVLGLMKHKVKFYQASTSELFGGAMHQSAQNEQTKFHPKSPYGCAKLFAHALVVNYRESYDMYAVNGILFNHESPRRGENFVTRKISRSVAEIHTGKRQFVELGNLDARRDWGHAQDYVEAMWLMMQQTGIPKDYVIATGESHSVREFVEEAFEVVNRTIRWQGKGLDEVGIDEEGIVRVKINEKFFRPSEVNCLLGDSSLARKELGWSPKTSFKQLVHEMVNSDIEVLTKKPYMW